MRARVYHVFTVSQTHFVEVHIYGSGGSHSIVRGVEVHHRDPAFVVSPAGHLYVGLTDAATVNAGLYRLDHRGRGATVMEEQEGV